jgi:hypothetical protein
MWLGRTELESFQTLRDMGLSPSFEIGTRVGRGFADLGYEEYCVLPGNRLQSLLTGTIAPLVDADKSRLFAILSVDEIVEQIVLKGYDVVSFSSPEQRDWFLELRVPKGVQKVLKGHSLLDSALAGLRYVLNEGKSIV